MLERLAMKLLENEVKEYNTNLLVEGIVLGSDIPHLNRYAFTESCCNEDGDTDISDLASKLSSIKFDDNLTIEDRKQLLYNAVSKTTLTETSDNSRLIELRQKYLEACRTNDTEQKKNLISQIKNLERSKS